MKKYDYVLVGAGLYSGVIAYLAGQAGKAVLYWNEEIIQAEIFTAKKSREFMYTSMERIFSILRIKRCGSLSIRWQNSTVIQTRRLPTTKAKFIICRSI